MELMKRQDTELWQVVDEPAQPILPMQQQVTNITYNVRIEGVAGWMAALAQMPASTVWAAATALGVLCAAVLNTLLIVATVAMQFVFGLAAAVIVAIVALVVLAIVIR
jgi:hypothetical protein